MLSKVGESVAAPAVADLNRKVVKGAAWMVAFKIIERLIGVASTMILARLIVPADFGLVAIGMTILATLEVMTAFSFDLALIQNQNAERRHYDTAWTFNLLFAIANATILTLLAKPSAVFFAEPRVRAVIYWVAFGAFIDGFSNIGVVRFQKDLQLNKDFRFGISKKVAAFLVTLAFALRYRSYWALLAGNIASKGAGVLLSYCLHPYRPRPSLAARHELFHFSKWLLINNVLIFLSVRGDDFIVAKILGAQALGLYTVAYDITNLPTTELVWPISRAVFPAYSKLAGAASQLRAMFLRAISLIAILTVPAGIGLGLVAQPLVTVMLGPKWMNAVPLMHILAFFGVARTLNGPTGAIYLAHGKPNLIFYLSILQLGVAFPMLIWLVHSWGIVGAPWAVLMSVAVSTPVNYIWAMREIELPVSKVADALWRPLVASAFMYLAGVSWMRFWPAPAAIGLALVYLLAFAIGGAVFYIILVLMFWRLAGCPDGAERNIIEVLRVRILKTSVQEGQARAVIG